MVASMLYNLNVYRFKTRLRIDQFLYSDFEIQTELTKLFNIYTYK